jgi:hypothetical protein
MISRHYLILPHVFSGRPDVVSQVVVCRSSKLLAAGTTAKTKGSAGRRIAGAENPVRIAD